MPILEISWRASLTSAPAWRPVRAIPSFVSEVLQVFDARHAAKTPCLREFSFGQLRQNSPNHNAIIRRSNFMKLKLIALFLTLTLASWAQTQLRRPSRNPFSPKPKRPVPAATSWRLPIRRQLIRKKPTPVCIRAQGRTTRQPCRAAQARTTLVAARGERTGNPAPRMTSRHRPAAGG